MYIFSTKGHENSCPVCGFKMSEFLSHQRLGCSFCYIFLPKQIKTLVRSVQDGAYIHNGKKNSRYNSLMQQFFQHVTSNAAKENPENLEDYQYLQKLLDTYF